MKNNSGFALITVFLLISVMTILAGTYLTLTRSEVLLARASKESSTGFNAAEAGLNLRAGSIKGILDDFDLPEGTSPANLAACDSGAIGTGDLQCISYNFDNNTKATTYITEEATNPQTVIIPPGLPFQGLNAAEYRYKVVSVGRSSQNDNQAILEMTFRSRSVPIFQFSIFFEEDLEFFNGADMIINGPVHGNSDVYLASQDGGTLSFNNQVTSAYKLYRGMKSVNSCSGYSGTVRAKNPTTYANFASCSSNRTEVTNVSSWNDAVLRNIGKVEIPALEDIDPFSSGPYWQKADLRLVLRLNSSDLPNTSLSTTGIEVVDANGVAISAATSTINSSVSCPGNISSRVIGSTGPGTAGDKLRLYREYQHDGTTSDYERVLEIDFRNLLECIYDNPSIIDGKALNETSNGGLVLFFTIDGLDSNASHNNYSVRIRNSATLKATTSSAPAPEGLAIVTNQNLILWGNFNSASSATWVPTSIISDSTYVLSNDWVDSDSTETDAYDRDGDAVNVNAALLTGVERTGGANGTAGQNHGADSNGGGVINIFRFNEWFRVGSSSIPDFTYVGSIASLGPPRHKDSTWGPFTYYSAPNRLWSYDTRFNSTDNLPPMTPSFTYLTQDLFARDYE